MKLQIPRSPHPDVIAGLSLLLALTGGTAWIIWQTNHPRLVIQSQPSTQIEQSANTVPSTGPHSTAKAQPTSKTPIFSAPTAPKRVPSGEETVTQPIFEPPAQVYWLQARGQQIEMVPVAMSRVPQRTETATLTEALNYLFTHPKLDRLDSTIPKGTRLLSLQIKPEGIHLNLSQEFTQGGGSTSMIYRVAQVLYTATSLDPQAKMYLSVEGKPLNEDNPLGGEGLILRQPMTRQQFVNDYLTQE
ncbi:MAG: GerMN domain-containing protein [Leptolyngbya sp. UWPOB_LEPTO1]|uniref:GerMN domain-containing protein n=1 Tax=Leptolyngbya sp. UWPOB_LEPTO1 TaxID=2815653 RepID=UPI001AD1783B|nr:GerMN domain-containing protein [Leptolyngbya sp. UWPOB_LEPTO1]MBN8561275.1 GerMN domain-containing protein [Leptolyngbya sp. UWPOB_LEPTO1]